MLGYQHDFHCGNHADVIKHAVLVLLIQALQRKPKPLRVIDAHAGSGIYDLASPEVRRNAEYRTGINRLLAPGSVPGSLQPYLDTVHALNAEGPLRRYPGSPEIARRLLRPDDHLELLELHPRAVTALRRELGGDPRVHIHARDSREGLPALLPPRERRGLVLIDPSYERKAEFEEVAGLLEACHRRWPAGTCLIWYPLITHQGPEHLVRKITRAGIPSVFGLELRLEPRSFDGLQGSGLLVVNPPWGSDEQITTLLPWLARTLAGRSPPEYHARWLVPPV